MSLAGAIALDLAGESARHGLEEDLGLGDYWSGAMIRSLPRLIGLYLAVAVGIGLIYYRGDRNVAMAVAAGLLCGLVIIPIEMRFMRDDAEARHDVLSGFPYFEALVAAVGIVLVILGALVPSLALGVSGLLFLGIALTSLAIKYGLRRLRD